MKTAIVSRNAEIDALTAQLNGGFIKIYSGKQPSSPEAAPNGKVLATLEFSDPAYEPATDGVAKSRPIIEDSEAEATGTASWFRCFKADGVTPVLDGSIGTANADLIFKTVEVQAKVEVRISALPITLPQ